MSDYGLGVFDQHAALLRASAISPEVARERGYQSVDTRTRLESIDIPKAHRLVPGLLIPVYGPESANGEAATWQYRPDHPRVNAKGKPVKYVTAVRGMVVDVPPAVKPALDDPSRPLWITEGSRKADSAVSAGIDCLCVLGVWNWRGGNTKGGTMALGAWEHIALNGRDVYLCFDSDVMVKSTVRTALLRFAGFLEYRKATVRLVMLPGADDGKTGLDDYLAAGGTVAELEDDGRVIAPGELDAFVRHGAEPTEEPYVPPEKRTLGETVDVFRRWLRLDDVTPVLVTAACVVANLAPGRPLWLLVVAPASSGKTEIAGSLRALPYVHVVSELTKSALLSGTSTRERARHATGGVLRTVGAFGILLAKDFTSVLVQNRDARAEGLSALREVADGYWERPVGTDGGQMLVWEGKCGFVGCVTPTIDRYHSVVNALGDRYLMVRLPDDADPELTALLAMTQNGREEQMARELSDAMGGLVAAADPDTVNRPLAEREQRALARLATFTARARGGVERDGYSQEVLVIPQPEGPGRLVTALRRLHGGLEAVGCDPETAWRVVGRVCVDCLPAVRTRLCGTLLDAAEPLRTADVAERLGMVSKTAHRHLEDLSLLGLADRSKTTAADNAPDLWVPSAWLLDYWPRQPESANGESRTEILSKHGREEDIDARDGPDEDGTATESDGPREGENVDDARSPASFPESLSHSADAPSWDWT